jgi:ATP-binding cassette subfamily B (MDR/TAP) protein 1
LISVRCPFTAFLAILRNEVGWFDDEENSADILSMRLANDATFVRAAFSNRLSIFIQDTSAIFVALLLGMLLEWRVALVALATLPILVISAVAQVSSHHLSSFWFLKIVRFMYYEASLLHVLIYISFIHSHVMMLHY